MTSELAGWVLTGVSTVIATLAGAVAVLFRSGEKRNAGAIEELREQVACSSESKDELEKFIRETLMKLVEDNAGLLRENQIVLSKCVNLMESLKLDENPAGRR
jgi:hypothetical protein